MKKVTDRAVIMRVKRELGKKGIKLVSMGWGGTRVHKKHRIDGKSWINYFYKVVDSQSGEVIEGKVHILDYAEKIGLVGMDETIIRR